MLPVDLAILRAAHLEVGAVEPGPHERSGRSPPRSGRSRPRGAGRSGRRRRCGCRTTARGGPCSSPSTRCASPAGPARSPCPTTARPAWGPSRARSRGRRPCRTRRPRPARPPGAARDRGGPAGRRPATSDPEEDRAVVGAVGVPALERGTSISATISSMCCGRARQDVRRASSAAPRRRRGTRAR